MRCGTSSSAARSRAGMATSIRRSSTDEGCRWRPPFGRPLFPLFLAGVIKLADDSQRTFQYAGCVLGVVTIVLDRAARPPPGRRTSRTRRRRSRRRVPRLPRRRRVGDERVALSPSRRRLPARGVRRDRTGPRSVGGSSSARWPAPPPSSAATRWCWHRRGRRTGALAHPRASGVPAPSRVRPRGVCRRLGRGRTRGSIRNQRRSVHPRWRRSMRARPSPGPTVRRRTTDHCSAPGITACTRPETTDPASTRSNCTRQLERDGLSYARDHAGRVATRRRRPRGRGNGDVWNPVSERGWNQSRAGTRGWQLAHVGSSTYRARCSPSTDSCSCTGEECGYSRSSACSSR